MTLDKKFSISKSLFTIAIPIIIQSLIFQLQSITDKHFIGLISTDYISAVGACGCPFYTLEASLLALCSGITIYVSQLYGKNDLKAIVSYVKSSIKYTVMIAFSIFLLWFFCGKYIFILMSVPDSILDYAVTYTKILSFIYIISGFQICLVCMLQGIGKTRPIMYCGFLSVCLNVFLDYALVLGKFGFPRLELKGAALATLISNVTSSLVIIILCFVTNYLPFNLIKEKVQGKCFSYYKKILAVSIPSGAEIFLWYFSNLILLSYLNSLGKDAVTIYTTVFSLEMIACCIFNSMGTASLSLSGNFLGKNNQPVAKKVIQLAFYYGVSISILLGIIMVFFPIPLVGLIIQDSNIKHMCVKYMYIAAIILIPKAINIVVGNGIRAYGDTRWMLRTQLIGSFFVILLSVLLIGVFNCKLPAIFLIVLFDETVRAIINNWHYFKGNLKNKISLENTNETVTIH